MASAKSRTLVAVGRKRRSCKKVSVFEADAETSGSTANRVGLWCVADLKDEYIFNQSHQLKRLPVQTRGGLRLLAKKEPRRIYTTAKSLYDTARRYQTSDHGTIRFLKNIRSTSWFWLQPCSVLTPWVTLT